ncbi:MAG TPA: hypothetical protein VHM93_14250 [Candidatus Acidoferrum sp.]|nr:hypothetical protein [Candidatus Acidoferrum sp.]
MQGGNLLCDKVRLAVTLTGIVSGAAAQKHGEEQVGRKRVLFVRNFGKKRAGTKAARALVP